MNPVLIIGCGDIGERVARLCIQDGAKVSGLVRSNASAIRLRELQITPIIADLADPDTLHELPSHELPTKDADIFYFAPPPPEGEKDPCMQHFLASINEDALPACMVLISTTAVYGDCEGAWITEEQPVNPQTDRGKRRLDAENTCRNWTDQHGIPLVILRVGGIYGPGRLPIARLQKGLPVLREEESPFTNRIHQDDLARICVAAASYGHSGQSYDSVFNVADGHPGTMSQYFKDVARACGLSEPPEISKEEALKQMTAGMLSYLRESRRIDNSKLIKELDIALMYPTLEDGLQNCER